MLNKLKQIKITRRTAYITLACCMLLVGGIGIFTAVRNMNKIVDDIDVIGESSFTPIDSFDPDVFESSNNNEDSEPIVSVQTPVELNYIMPASGEVCNGFSGLELVYSETMNDYRTHSGIDILSSQGDAVVSAEAGKIINVTDDPLWGQTVQIEHADGMVTTYKNLSDVLPEGIEIGSYVASGGIIGTVGTTALVEIGQEPHVHFEMTVNGIPVDPMEYVK